MFKFLWFLFLFVLLLCLLVNFALFKAHGGYLHLLRALLRWSSSSFSSWLLEQTVLALCLKVLMTLNLAERWWWLSHCSYKSVCVGFLYTDVNRELSGFGKTIVAREGRDLSGLASSCKLDVWVHVVNMLQEIFFPWGVYDHKGVIHKPLPYSGRIYSWIDGSLISKSSIKRLATMGLMGDPIAVHCSCSKNLPWNWK